MLVTNWSINTRNKLSSIAAEFDSCADIEGAYVSPEQKEECKKHLLAVIKLFDEHDKARKINNKNHDKPMQDNRFRIIERAKKDLIESTSIETSADEMKVLDNILFRAWQMNWLEKYNKEKEEAEIIAKKIIYTILYNNDLIDKTNPSIDEMYYGDRLINITQALTAPVMQLGQEFFRDKFIEMFSIGDADERKAVMEANPALSSVYELINQYTEASKCWNVIKQYYNAK